VEKLDPINRAILMLLQEDGRMTNLELADRIQLSPTATSERLKWLTREKFITGYSARIDPVKVERGFLVFVEVLLDKTTSDIFARFAGAVHATPEILECHMVAGGFDYLIKTRVANMAAYRHFHGDVLINLPGVKETRTYAVMEEIKTASPLPI
jgi:Lrp/AsnC family transcriptional regulator, leucine-responsive regulatory protein